MSDLLEKLASSAQKHESSEHLQLLAKRAAGMFTGDPKLSLTGAVSNAIGGEDLNKDQVRRVSEMANQSAWRELFVEGGGDANVSFAPANADEILENIAETPATTENPNVDYLQDPPGERPPDVSIEEAFGVEKDPPQYDSLSPHTEAAQEQQKVAAAADVARHGADILLTDLQVTGEQFYNLVKQACIRDGHGILQISTAVGAVVESEKFATDLMCGTVTAMKEEGISFDMSKEMEKEARAVVANTDHPLLEAVVRLEKLAKAYTKADTAYANLKTKNSEALTYLRDKLRGQ
jgi:hypothetical protein